MLLDLGKTVRSGTSVQDSKFFNNSKFSSILLIFFIIIKDNNINALVSYSCCDKVLQIGWLTTTEMHCLIDLEGRSPKSRCWYSCVLSETWRENPVALLTFRQQSWCSLAYKYICASTIISCSFYMSLSPPLILSGSQPYWPNTNPNFKLTTSARRPNF